MNIKDYILSKGVTLCFLGIGTVVLVVSMAAAEADTGIIFLSFTFISFLILGWIVCGFIFENRRLEKLERILDEVGDKYLAGEILPMPLNPAEKRYYEIMKTVSRSAINEVENAVREKEEYQDYLESWVHEIKTPLTACFLILDNKADIIKLKKELKRADNLTESILYYGRMRTIENDIQIKEIKVSNAMNIAVKSQMELLISAGISVDISGDFKVYTDEKSLIFIFKQILVNCSKYCLKCHVELKADSERGVIIVRDNGIGIHSYEINRVFDRGFTGTNGNLSGNGTGMGLYIVKELCGHLKIDISVDSKIGEYTEIKLAFESFKPVSA